MKFDKKKIKLAEQNGYYIKTVWQYDFENTKDKIKFVKELLNG